jgi:outer membrane scaffolding protein for murein synthesis (MipA/OmpV family)
MESYFTINAADSIASGLSIYKAESGFKDVGVNLSLHYIPWQNWGIMGLFSYKRLLSDAEDSPVTDIEGNNNQFIAGLMFTYRF